MEHRPHDRRPVLALLATSRPVAVVARVVGITALAAAALTVAAPSAQAFGTPAACTGRSEAAVFSRWGDTFTYFRMPNGGFEAGTTDWQLGGGAAVVSGNESYRVGGAMDSWSLRIPYGATAESRTICVSAAEDTIRLFVFNPKVSGSILHVEAIARNPATGRNAVTTFDVNGDAAPYGWAPTMRLKIPNLLGISGTQELTLSLTTRGAAATWLVDDVYVDPFKSY